MKTDVGNWYDCYFKSFIIFICLLFKDNVIHRISIEKCCLDSYHKKKT